MSSRNPARTLTTWTLHIASHIIDMHGKPLSDSMPVNAGAVLLHVIRDHDRDILTSDSVHHDITKCIGPTDAEAL